MNEQAKSSAHAVIDFNPETEEHARNWADNLGQLRKKCPVAWSTSLEGFWLVTRYDDITRIARDPQTYSSAKTVDPTSGKIIGGASIPTYQKAGLLPLESDPPEWKVYRDLLNPFFGPAIAESWRGKTIALADSLLDRVIESGEMDIVNDYTSAVPTLLTLEILGIEVDDWRKFVEPVHKLVHTAMTAPEFPGIMAGMRWVEGQLGEEAERCRANPGRGVINALAQATVDGKPLPIAEIQRMGMLVIAGGAHTTTALTSNALYYLHQHHDARRKLREDPAALAPAREEFLRYFSPVHGVARTVMKDVDIRGQHVCPGDRVMLSYASANRDEAVFEAPDEVMLDRFPNRHIGFGMGIHRCLGSFLARMMSDVIVSRFLERVPDYRVIEETAQPSPLISKINTWVAMPATFTPGAKIGSTPVSGGQAT